jgi:hypothetical protein
MEKLGLALIPVLKDVVLFCEATSGLKLRSYQEEAARAIVESVAFKKGLSFVVLFPRQSGKNELQAQIETYVMVTLNEFDTEIVKASPTWKPQTQNAMRRLERVLSRNLITEGRWAKESGYIYRFNQARVIFLSGSPQANVVGATANELLECDEAQDIQVDKWDKDFAPMAASTNATRVFWGTAWTAQSLLGRELRNARAAEQLDGVRRTFVLTADQVAEEVPAYGLYVSEQVRRHGRQHPLIKSQFFSEEITSEGGMFPSERLQLVRGTHRAASSPQPGRHYAITIDMAGERSQPTAGSFQQLSLFGGDEPGRQRDSTVLTILEVDISTLRDIQVQAPRYRVQQRMSWNGVRQSDLYAQIRTVMEAWLARWLVIDATGLGAGMASFLSKTFPGKVLPFVFTQKSKSELGWKFLAAIETGRYQEAVETYPDFASQAVYCQMEVLPGPQKVLRWGVPDGTRDELTNTPVHDDIVMSAALCAVLDEQEWAVTAAPVIVPAADPLLAMDKEGF